MTKELTPPYKVIGNRISNLRKDMGISRTELAQKAHISTKFLYEIENGKKGFTVKTLLNLATVLNADCNYILTGKLPVKR